MKHPARTAIAIALLANAVTADIRDDLNTAEQAIREGRGREQHSVVRVALEDLTTAGRLATPEGFQARRLQLRAELEITKSPTTVRESVEKLLAEAEETLGPDHIETGRTTMLLAISQRLSRREAESIPTWRKAGRIMQRASPEPSRDMADCYFGLGYSMIDGWDVRVSFDGNTELPFAPQVNTVEVDSKSTAEGKELCAKGIRMHRGLGGKADEVGARCEKQLQEYKLKIDQKNWKEVSSSIERLKTQTHSAVRKEAQDALGAWMVLHPDPLVDVCLGGDAECYHTLGCSTTERCSTRTVAALTAWLYGRRRCLVCDPPLPSVPPSELLSYRFDGIEYDVLSNGILDEHAAPSVKKGPPVSYTE